MIKEFDTWSSVKQRLDNHRTPPTFAEREIWWTSVGLNIGFEIYGKDATFTRPVLIIRKFSRYTFLGAPLTSSVKQNSFRYPYTLKGRSGTVILDQARTYDCRRLADVLRFSLPYLLCV